MNTGVRCVAIGLLVARVAAAAPSCGGQTCAPGQVCCGNACCSKQEACVADGKIWCAGQCFDPKTNPAHCGSCAIHCGGYCTNGACVPPSVHTVRSSLYKKDLKVAVSSQHILASCNSAPAFELRRRVVTGPGPVPQGPFFPLVTDPLLSGSGLANLFNGLLYPPGPFNLNAALAGATPVACTPDINGVFHPPDFDCVSWPNGVVMSVADVNANVCKGANVPADHKGHNPYPTTSCFASLYDDQIMFDHTRQRFWIMTHAGNRIGNPTCDPSATDHDLCNQLSAEAWKRNMLAVSKTTNPADGFWTYGLFDDYNDMPFLAVDNDFVILYHQAFVTGKAGKVPWMSSTPRQPAFRVYDAASLAHPSGAPAVAGQATPGAATELAVINMADGKNVMAGTGMKGIGMRVAKHHEGEPNTTFIVSEGESAGGMDLWVYALVSPHPAGKTALIGPAHFVAPEVLRVSEAVFSDGNLYFSYAVPHAPQVGLYRVPITTADVLLRKELPANTVKSWTLNVANESAALPTLDVTNHQDVVVSWVAHNAATEPTQIKYAVLYHWQPQFSPIARVEDAAFMSGPKGGSIDLDYTGSQRDELDPSSVWTILADRDGVVLSLIRP